MLRNSLLTGRALVLALAGALVVGPALAEKPSWAGEKGGKNRGDEHRGEQDGPRGQDRDGDEGASQVHGRRSNELEHFGDRHRSAVRDYYNGQFQSGRCPPGLAKKNNGCMPPGQAKKWELGRPLSRNVIFYEVPRPLVRQLGQPPAGYRYVRVADDILVIQAATAIVVDAIRGLGR
ncbi:MAG: hypothetical protein ABIN45_01090 [Gammaproteobacteria bacterium]